MVNRVTCQPPSLAISHNSLRQHLELNLVCLFVCLFIMIALE